VILVLLLACGTEPEGPSSPAMPGCRAVEGTQCYWMDNGPGETCWIPMPEADRTECKLRDSCAGGGGTSNGGCYKWARCSTCPGETW
jgi:hypothetical protein